jgi:AcrR family transcriptional regulator
MSDLTPFPTASHPQSPPTKALLAAERLAIEHGFDEGFTIEQVAREAGLAVEDVRREFPDRMALERAVAFRSVTTSQQSLGIPLELKQDLPALLGNFLHMAFDSIDEIESRYQVQLRSMARGGELLREVVEATCVPIIQLVRGLIQERRPDLTAAELDARATLFVGVCDQYAHVRWTYFKHLKLESPASRFFYEYRKLAETQIVKAVLA